MQIGSNPTNPFHIARAYGIPAPRPAAPVAASANVSRLTAGAVPGAVSFAPAEPAGPAEALPFYRHPADRNAAATAILSAGRTIDVTG